VTAADCVVLPPLPVQVRIYVVFALSAPVDCDPLTLWLPDQPPAAVQAVALVEVQDKVELLPLATLVGLALNASVGAEADCLTETEVDATASPPGPEHVSV
jgi:hypothetical protein